MTMRWRSINDFAGERRGDHRRLPVILGAGEIRSSTTGHPGIASADLRRDGVGFHPRNVKFLADRRERRDRAVDVGAE